MYSIFDTISQKKTLFEAPKFLRENFGGKFWRENFGAKFWREFLYFFPPQRHRHREAASVKKLLFEHNLSKTRRKGRKINFRILG